MPTNSRAGSSPPRRIYHFLFVPVTIGLAFLVAILQTSWYRTDNPDHRRMTRFFGTLLLINVAIGVVTGLVQEFEFGMNWSTYSRFVGGVFGAPLAMEGLLAFFLESTFLGLWLFGWDRLPKRVHLATIWAVSVGSMLSAMFILIANSWMQHPVGYQLDRSGQAILNNVWALFVNPTFVWGYAHVILASLVTGCLVMLAVSAWYLRRERHVESFHRTAKLALIVLIPTIIIQMSVGNQLGVIEANYQPMKIAAAEAQWKSCKPCSFSLSRSGAAPTTTRRRRSSKSRTCCRSWRPGPGTARSPGSTSSRRNTSASTGPATTSRTCSSSTGRCGSWPTWPRSCCCWRCGAAGCCTGARSQSRVFLWLWVWAVVTPFLMNTAGWLLTESGRQPWIVQGLQKTVEASSPSVSATEIWISLMSSCRVHRPGRHRPGADARYSRRVWPRPMPSRPGADGGPAPPCPPSPTDPMQLHTVWFIIIAVLWVGFFVLEGFDFGVGALHPSSAGTRPSGASRSTPSGRGGTATRCG